MPNLTETFLRMRSPVGEMLGQYNTSRQMAGQKESREAQLKLAQLDFDLRSQMEQRRQGEAEAKAKQEHADNLIGAGDAFKKVVHEAAYQGIVDPNAYLALWAKGVAPRFGLNAMDTPPVAPEEIEIIVKQAQGDRVLADAKAAKDALKEAPKGRTIQRGTQKVYQEFDPVNGGWTDVASGPEWKPDSGGGDKAENDALDAEIAIRQYFGKLAMEPDKAPLWTIRSTPSYDIKTGKSSPMSRFDTVTALKNIEPHILEIPGMTAKKYRAWKQAQAQEQPAATAPTPAMSGGGNVGQEAPADNGVVVTGDEGSVNTKIGSGVHKGKHGVFYRTQDGKTIFEPDED